MTNYQDFEIQVFHQGEGRYRLRSQSSSGLTPEQDFFPPPIPGIKPSGKAARGIVDERQSEFTVDATEQIGAQLFDATFHTATRDHLIRHTNQPLRLILTLSEVAELHQLPWERLQFGNCRMGRDVHYSIVRGLEGLHANSPSPPTNPQLLIASALPKNMAPLKLEHEIKAIQQAVPPNWCLELLEGASKPKLEQSLARGCHLFHFMGHGLGDRAGLCLQDQGGFDRILTPEDLCDLFAGTPRARLPQIIVLNMCSGGRTFHSESRLDGVAKRLVAYGIPHVIAMTDAIVDKAALEFSEAFYKSLASGDVLDLAITKGRRAIPLQQAWHLPAYFSSVTSENLWRVSEVRARTPLPFPKKRFNIRGWHKACFALLTVAALLLWPAWFSKEPNHLTQPHIYFQRLTIPEHPKGNISIADLLPENMPIAAEVDTASLTVNPIHHDSQLSLSLTNRDDKSLFQIQTPLPNHRDDDLPATLLFLAGQVFANAPLELNEDQRLDLATSLNQQGLIVLDQGNATLAKSLFYTAHEIAPESAGSANLAVMFWQQGSFELAVEFAEEAVSSQLDAHNQTLLATILAPSDPTRALKILERVALSAPSLLEAHTLRARIYQQTNRTKMAEKTFRACLEQNPAYPPALHGLADIALANNQLEIALTWLNQAARSISPEQLFFAAEILYKRGDCYFQLDQPEQAKSIFQAYLNLPGAQHLDHWDEVNRLQNTVRLGAIDDAKNMILLTRGTVLVDDHLATEGTRLNHDSQIVLGDKNAEVLLVYNTHYYHYKGPRTIQNAPWHAPPAEHAFKERNWLHPSFDNRLMAAQRGRKEISILAPMGKVAQQRPEIVWIPDPAAYGYLMTIQEMGFTIESLFIGADQVPIKTWQVGHSQHQVAILPWPFKQSIDTPLSFSLTPQFNQNKVGATTSQVDMTPLFHALFTQADAGIDAMSPGERMGYFAKEHAWGNALIACQQYLQTGPPPIDFVEIAELHLAANHWELAMKWHTYADTYSLPPLSQIRNYMGLGHAALACRDYSTAENAYRDARLLSVRHHQSIATKMADVALENLAQLQQGNPEPGSQPTK